MTKTQSNSANDLLSFRKDDLLLLLFSAVFIAVASISLIKVGSDARPYNSGLANLQFYLILAVGATLGSFCLMLLKERPASPFAFLFKSPLVRTKLKRYLRGIGAIVAVALFMPAFTAMKSAIPMFNDYDWDATFIAWDIAIHGTDPWRLLQPMFGYPIVTSAISSAYHLWFLLIYIGPIWFALFEKDQVLRFRFFLGFLLTWTSVGVVLAICLASVGPCFVEPILGNAHFNEQMHYLHEANRQYPISVLGVQDMLLEWYREGSYGLGRGISAMPSMHVALATLYVPVLWRIDRRLGFSALAFLLIIFIGSVHLGYHYAVDGYLAAIVAIAIWLVTKPIANRVVV